jgi:hypothetical protein
LPLAKFDGAKNDAFLGVFHGTIKEDKGKELTFKGFKSPVLMDTEDAEVNLLHVIFNFKGVLVGKEYFRVDHLLPPPFNLIWGPTLLSKSIVPRPTLKEFILRCLEQLPSIYGPMFCLPRCMPT